MSDKYRRISKDLSEGIMLLSGGIAKIERAKSKNWYQKLKGFANALAGGNLPSLDPGISDLKSVTNVYSGAEEMNTTAERVLSRLSSNYYSTFNKTIKKFYNTSKALFDLKYDNTGYLESKISDDPRLNVIRDLYLQKSLSEDNDGWLSKSAPINIVTNILKKMSGISASLRESVEKNISSLHMLSRELENGEFPDNLEGAVIDVCREIFVFESILTGFAQRQRFNRERNKRRSVEEPVGSDRGRDDEPTESGATEAGATEAGITGYDIQNYYVESFVGSRKYSDSSIDSANNRIGDSDSGVHTILFGIIKRDNSEIAESELKFMNENEKRILNDLVISEKLTFNSDFIRKEFRDNYMDSSFIRENSYRVICSITLRTDFKNNVYRAVEDGEVIIELKNEDTRVDLIVKANEKKNIIKKSETATSPFYQTVSPSGDKVNFTPTDLVRGMGKLKDPKTGKSFKPKKVKGKSLADRVMSKDYGKVKK